MAHRETASQPPHPQDTPSQRFGAVVRRYRQQRKLTQRALAARIGVHPRYMSKIEMGQHTIGVVLLFRLARILVIPAASLLASLEPAASCPAEVARQTTASVPSSTQDSASSQVLQRLGVAIRRARHAQQLSQPALAAKIGLDVSYLSNMERGQRNFSVVVLVRLADALGLSVAQLLAPLEMDSHASASRTP